MTVGDIVVVIKSESIPSMFLGRYGRIINEYGDKVEVLLEEGVNGKGGLSHTAYPSDLMKIGETDF